MSCKNCNKKSGGMIKNILNLKKEISKPTKNTKNKESELYNYEKVILTIFGWIPLAIGYYHVVKFIINLF
tara:strand:+ start:417 stop:626 length:210 start_codon:yes stop_codon:yes gene_type:complete